MRQFIQAIWWWLRVAVIVIVGVYALLSLWNNTGKPITVWYWFGREEGTSVVGLAVASFIAGGVVCSTALALFTATIRYRRTREHRRLRAIEEHREALAKKASMLRTKPAPAPIVRTRGLTEPLVTEAIVEEYRLPSKTQATKLETLKEKRIELAEMPPRDVSGEEPIHVSTHRATPFASTPAIAPGVKLPEKPALVDEDKSGPLSPVSGGEG